LKYSAGGVLELILFPAKSHIWIDSAVVRSFSVYFFLKKVSNHENGLLCHIYNYKFTDIMFDNIQNKKETEGGSSW